MESSRLGDTLSQVRSRIARYGGSRQLNEENTKATLVEPILRALGWGVEDMEEVQREYKRRPRDKPVDYALLVMRAPRLFIEAKALGQNLEDRRWASQIMGYATVAGVEWVVLTNGDEYRLYNAHVAVAVEEKLFRSVKVTGEGLLAEDTLELLSKSRMQENRLEVLWKAHFVDRQIHDAIEDLFAADPDPGIVRLIKKRTANLSSGEIRASLARAELRLDFPIKLEPSVIRPADKRGRGKREIAKPGNGGSVAEVSVFDLIQADLIRPPLELKKTYKRRELVARIESEGQITCLGETYDSLSMAAGVARASVIGVRPGRKFPPTNGWTFWKFQNADGELKEIDYLRQEYRKRKR